MQRKLLIGSLLLNVVLVSVLAGGAFRLAGIAKNFSRIAAERWRTQFDFIAERKGGIVFLGDSITEGGHSSELFDDCAVLNRGIGGDTTQDALDRIPQVYALEPAKLFVMIGVNDLNERLALATTLANYSRLFDGIAANLPRTRIYVQSVLPVNDQWRWDDNEGIAQLNAFLQAESARRGYTWIDLHKDFRDEDGKLRSELSNDGIHLLGAGYRLWRDLIRARVEE